MSGIEEPPPGAPPPPNRPPDAESRWPAQDLGEPAQDAAGTSPNVATEGPWDVKTYGNRRRPTRAEQAVPWLIGLVLALSGMMIVLLALIFSSNEGLLPAYGTPSPEPSIEAATPRPRPTPSLEPSLEPSPSVEPTPTPVPAPTYPPFEVVFMQRTSASGPTHLFTHDFAGQAAPVPQARDNRGVDWYDWAPDGAHGIALVEGNPLLLTPGSSARDLGDGFDSIAYAADSTTAYGLRSTLAGANDRAELLRIDTVSGAATSVAVWTYPHPTTFQESVVKEARFADDGGFERVYVLEDGRVVVWVLGAPAVYTFDPATGTAGTTNRQPLLWAPNGLLRAAVTDTGSDSRIAILGLAGEERGALSVSGLVSHVRWSANSNQIVFTINRGTSSGGVSQDLYAWDLHTGSAAQRLTQDLRSLGPGYRGAEEIWKP
ncbi:MAG TPA: hypothetical protein VFP83_04030 [Candidatus Limnocylindria bacterium]|nr:hypothetical protein [Candidatus Limnocylindria bacterium]